MHIGSYADEADDPQTQRRMQHLLEEASEIVADGPADDPQMAEVIDVALTHLVESEQNIQDPRDEHPPHVIQSIANTSVLTLRYRTRVESRWR